MIGVNQDSCVSGYARKNLVADHIQPIGSCPADVFRNAIIVGSKAIGAVPYRGPVNNPIV